MDLFRNNYGKTNNKDNNNILKEITNLKEYNNCIINNKNNAIVFNKKYSTNVQNKPAFEERKYSNNDNSKNSNIKLLNKKDYENRLSLAKENEILKKKINAYKDMIEENKIEIINNFDKENKVKSELEYYRQYYKLLTINMINIVKSEKLSKKSLLSLTQLFSPDLDEPEVSNITKKFNQNYERNKKFLEKAVLKKIN